MPFDRPSAYLDDDGVTAVVLDPTDNFIAVRPAGGAWKRCGPGVFTIGALSEMNLIEDAKAAAALLAEARAALDRKVLPMLAFVGPTAAAALGVDTPFGIKRLKPGIYPIPTLTDVTAAKWNVHCHVSREQLTAMTIGALFGWDAPGANPADTARRLA